ncbi:CDP-diacylglycerol diphosphatase [Methylocella sp.]|uniref:CDP-diacylglycerol diphosphatase n=1 Tax=Methylocella sp. TaxID=1978226 RepID=UPI003784E5E0
MPGLSRLRCAAILLAALCVGANAPEESPDALWMIVDRLCAPAERLLGSPAPCVKVDLSGGSAKGWAVLKDLVGKTQFLLIPTQRMSGVEDPRLVEAGAPNYWAPAWSARVFMEKAAGRPLARGDVSLAINGAGARTQDQLHIHIDCPRADVARELAARLGEIGDAFGDFSLRGETYRARFVAGEELRLDPFHLVAADGPSAPLKDNSLALFGVERPDSALGFVLLARKAPGGTAHLEDLQDHRCAILGATPPKAASDIR